MRRREQIPSIDGFGVEIVEKTTDIATSRRSAACIHRNSTARAGVSGL
jgi:hypothetical protein